MTLIPLSTIGLSPQVRGNLEDVGAPETWTRSIPAGAGEPHAANIDRIMGQVYPRRCGGTVSTPRGGESDEGLSPQVRGNRAGVRGGRRRSGSIPAGAGEPSWSGGTRSPPRVYPRRCGGTRAVRSIVSTARGLSPQVRGNRARRAATPSTARSIPAGAGEPAGQVVAFWRGRVYPRRCGGTLARSRSSVHRAGLSPQVRGNRRDRRHRPPGRGSIPAGAGEPAACLRRRGRRRVYPRRCGGTPQCGRGGALRHGLSPQVRGNPALGRAHSR